MGIIALSGPPPRRDAEKQRLAKQRSASLRASRGNRKHLGNPRAVSSGHRSAPHGATVSRLASTRLLRPGQNKILRIAHEVRHPPMQRWFDLFFFDDIVTVDYYHNTVSMQWCTLCSLSRKDRRDDSNYQSLVWTGPDGAHDGDAALLNKRDVHGTSRFALHHPGHHNHRRQR